MWKIEAILIAEESDWIESETIEGSSDSWRYPKTLAKIGIQITSNIGFTCWTRLLE